MSFLSNLFGGSTAYKEITPAQLNQLAPKKRVIDVRQPEEFEGDLGHLEEAELVPLATLSAAAVSWDKTQPYLLVCRSGGRSSSACSTLSRMGFSDVTNLRGGMLAVRSNSNR